MFSCLLFTFYHNPNELNNKTLKLKIGKIEYFDSLTLDIQNC